MTTIEKADKLDDFANYEGTELGEYWTLLYEMYRSDCLSGDIFKSQIGCEIEIQYEFALELIEDGALELE
tara:strand:- start:27931 stop:28140 length:210 start_codon:yes stop_codon:yes gene_type:complete